MPKCPLHVVGFAIGRAYLGAYNKKILLGTFGYYETFLNNWGKGGF